VSVDIEAGGALATAGLAAAAIEGQGGAPAKEHAKTCANCRAALVGAFCHACGQTGHVHRSILHMLEEGLHGILHFDSKTWRTLPLLVARPGLLTRRYIDGQRVRYVAPLALFLFTMFMMFFVFSFIGNEPKTLETATPTQAKQAREQLVGEVDEAKAEVTKREAALAAASADEREDATAELEEAKSELRVAEAVLSVFDKAETVKDDPTKTAVLTGEELKTLSGLDFGNVESQASGALSKLTKNPELMAYKFKNTAYKFSFMLIPISLPFLWLMFFWRKGVTTYDHLVFSMYSLSFMSLLFIVVVLLSMSSFTQSFVPYLLLIPPLHIFLQLRETYGLSFGSALWRTIALLTSAGTASLLFLLMIVVLIAM